MNAITSWEKNLDEAKKQIAAATRLSYTGLTILKDNSFLIKIFNELTLATTNLVKAYLLYEAQEKAVRLYKDPLMNLKVFVTRVAPKYIEKKDIDNILRMLKLGKKHEKASFEFLRRDKFVILNDNEYFTLSITEIKQFIISINRLFSKFPKKE